jgi:hypothetical protein
VVEVSVAAARTRAGVTIAAVAAMTERPLFTKLEAFILVVLIVAAFAGLMSIPG